MKKLTSFFLIFFIFIIPGYGFAIDHSIYNDILEKCVKNSEIDLIELSKIEPMLNQYLQSYRLISWTEVSKLSREKQMAFWINGFNALMLRFLLRDRPSSSQVLFKIELKDRSVTLPKLRDDVLRRQFRDERIHFAILDGTSGGPRLKKKAYSGVKLDEELDEQIRRFLEDPSRNQIRIGSKRLVLSYLFKKFEDDFLVNYGISENHPSKFTRSQFAVLSFIAQYSAEAVRDYLSRASYRIEYSSVDKQTPPF